MSVKTMDYLTNDAS